MVTQIELFESPELAPSDLIMVVDEERSVRNKGGGHTRRIDCSHLNGTACLPACIKKRVDQLKQHAIFTR
jgi:hypothetical protein